MTNESERPIIIRRIKKIKKSGHHGGSWKIAYADFVTAMMAFFLLMWLLGLMNKYQLQGIAEYFKKPLKHAFEHESDRRGLDKKKDKADNKEKFTEKNKEKNTEKETQKEKPNKVDQTQNKSSMMIKGDAQQLAQLKSDMESKLQNDPVMRQYKNQLNFEVTADGLKITLHDLENKQMFTSGKADFEKYAKNIVGWLSKELSTFPNRIMIIGHTDVLPYDSNDYSNWELSADRANAARRALVNNGMSEYKIVRVVGVGDTQLLNKNNGLDAKNRRIEIIILSDDAMKKIRPN